MYKEGGSLFSIVFMSIFFTKKGKGPGVILLHGWGGSHLSMAGLQDQLYPLGYEVFNLDLPGFGESPLIKPAMTLNDYLKVLQDFIAEQKIENPILVGHSFGGKIISKLALSAKIPIKGLVLISASCIKPQNDSKKSILRKITGFGKMIFSQPFLRLFFKPIRKFYYYYIVRERDFFDAGEKLRQTFINVNDIYLDDELTLINLPTLVIWGEVDTVTPLWMGEKIAELIPQARMEVVANARHYLIKEMPEIVSKIIYNYFNSI